MPAFAGMTARDFFGGAGMSDIELFRGLSETAQHRSKPGIIKIFLFFKDASWNLMAPKRLKFDIYYAGRGL